MDKTTALVVVVAAAAAAKRGYKLFWVSSVFWLLIFLSFPDEVLHAMHHFHP